MCTELKRLHERLKATFIDVTHDQAKAMTMADRIVVMSTGKIGQLGAPPEIYNHPTTQFVAGFFGTPTMNFVEGVVEIGAAGARFCGAGLEQALPASVSVNLCGRKVVLGVCSEHVIIGDAAAAAPARSCCSRSARNTSALRRRAGQVFGRES